MTSSAGAREGSASKKRVMYEVTNGVRIENLGEKRFVTVSDEGLSRQITAQVCDVNQGLLSVRRMVQQGGRVVFDARGSYIEDSKT